MQIPDVDYTIKCPCGGTEWKLERLMYDSSMVNNNELKMICASCRKEFVFATNGDHGITIRAIEKHCIYRSSYIPEGCSKHKSRCKGADNCFDYEENK